MMFQFFNVKSELANNRYNITKLIFDLTKCAFCLLVPLVWFYHSLNAYQRDVIDQINRGEDVDLSFDQALAQTMQYSARAIIFMLLVNILEFYLNRDRDRLSQRVPDDPTLANCIKCFPGALFLLGQLMAPILFLFLLPLFISNSVPNANVQSDDFIASLMKPIGICATIIIPICACISRLTQLLLANKDKFENSAMQYLLTV